jgi:CheY-like chemotaxis protein
MSHPLPAGGNPAERTRESVSSRAPLTAAGARPSILVVDDEPAIRDLLQACLNSFGFRVCLAADGREAIERYRRDGAGIAVVLLDIRMPGLDGPQTLEALRQLNPEVQVCFMSGDLGAYETDELLQRGARHVFGKPLRLVDVAQVLGNLAGAAADGPGRLDGA